MDLFDAILGRVSSPKLTEPAPSGAELERIFRCALRAPDHGLLRPWRFIVFRGGAREELGGLCADAERERQPEAPPEALARVRANPLRAPLVVACVATVTTRNPKVPPIEQVASMAAAVQNMQLAAHALGYGAMWRTGPAAADPGVKRRLGLAESDEIVAFLYLGTPEGPRRPVESLDPAQFVSEWGAR